MIHPELTNTSSKAIWVAIGTWLLPVYWYNVECKKNCDKNSLAYTFDLEGILIEKVIYLIALFHFCSFSPFVGSHICVCIPRLEEDVWSLPPSPSTLCEGQVSHWTWNSFQLGWLATSPHLPASGLQVGKACLRKSFIKGKETHTHKASTESTGSFTKQRRASGS